MKGAKKANVTVVFLFLLLIVSYVTGYYLYIDYQHTCDALEKRNYFVHQKYNDLEQQLLQIGGILKSYDKAFTKHAEGLLQLEARIDSGEIERKAMMLGIRTLRENVVTWQKEYSSALAEFRIDIEEVSKNIESKTTPDIEQVDLGEIAIDKEQGIVINEGK